MITRWLKAVAATLLMGAAAASCSSNEQSFYADIPAEGWIYGDALTFTTDSVAVEPGSEMVISLTHNNDYPYRNLWIEVNFMSADSMRHNDTVNIELCDRYGRWYGKGFGATYQIEAPLASRWLPVQASRIKVRQIMRVDTLKGIEKLGLSIMPPRK